MRTRTSAHLGWNRSSLKDQKRFDPRIVFEAGLRHHHIANTAYPIHHQTTMRPYRVPRDQAESTALAAWRSADKLGLYVHVPFCAARCKYCEYAVVEHNERDAQNAYFGALLREIEMYRDRLDTENRTLVGFDIGGGTPSFVQVEHIRRIVEAVRASFRFGPDMAISIETTPIIADREPEKMNTYKEMGIDRISMGVQTTHFKLARSLGREYEGMTMLESAVRNIRDAGFGRFNIDLMYGFADQSPEAWRNTVQQTLTLEPEYVTLYQMRYKGTRIQSQATHVTRDRVNALKHIARDLLLTAGYTGTPGKNTYSRVPGDEGTSDYLTERVVKGSPYLGLGLAAQSLSQYTLSYNAGAASKTLSPYLRAIHAQILPIQDLYHLDLGAAMGKMIAVSFYFGQIHRGHFAAKFGVRLEDQYANEIAFALENGFMEQVGPYLRLTDKGADHFNGIVALFYAGAVKDYLVRLGSSFATPVTHGPLREAA